MAKKDKPRSNLSLSDARPKTKIIPSVSSMNDCQKTALRSIADPQNYIVFLNGIAGTGKTYISASWGIEQLLKGKFDRLVLTRPYVEAGESLGYLPGDFGTKIAPFMIPIFDVLHEHLTAEEVKGLTEAGKIVTLPLAYMRGVTFKKSFVLLDEAQNSSARQMHLFLTRIGQDSKMVITGDSRQSDLGPNNGFTDAIERLGEPKLEGIDVVHFDPKNVVRHGIIPAIDGRYNKKLEG